MNRAHIRNFPMNSKPPKIVDPNVDPLLLLTTLFPTAHSFIFEKIRALSKPHVKREGADHFWSTKDDFWVEEDMKTSSLDSFSQRCDCMWRWKPLTVRERAQKWLSHAKLELPFSISEKWSWEIINSENAFKERSITPSKEQMKISHASSNILKTGVNTPVFALVSSATEGKLEHTLKGKQGTTQS